MNKKNFSYTEAVAELERIMNKLENEEIDLDVLAENVKKASDLILKCKEKLRDTEADVDDIVKKIGKT